MGQMAIVHTMQFLARILPMSQKPINDRQAGPGYCRAQRYRDQWEDYTGGSAQDVSLDLWAAGANLAAKLRELTVIWGPQPRQQSPDRALGAAVLCDNINEHARGIRC